MFQCFHTCIYTYLYVLYIHIIKYTNICMYVCLVQYNYYIFIYLINFPYCLKTLYKHIIHETYVCICLQRFKKFSFHLFFVVLHSISRFVAFNFCIFFSEFCFIILNVIATKSIKKLLTLCRFVYIL